VLTDRSRSGHKLTTAASLSPTFLVAANFIILGRLIRLIGEQYSRLKPNACEYIWTSPTQRPSSAFVPTDMSAHPDAYIFLAIDTASLVVQAVGGAQASIAITLDAANRGAKVMLGGIILQFGAPVQPLAFRDTASTNFWVSI